MPFILFLVTRGKFTLNTKKKNLRRGIADPRSGGNTISPLLINFGKVTQDRIMRIQYLMAFGNKRNWKHYAGAAMSAANRGAKILRLAHRAHRSVSTRGAPRNPFPQRSQGGQTKNTYRRKKSRGGKAIKRKRKFARKVKAALRPLMQISTQFESQATATPAVINGTSANFYQAGTLAGGSQLVWGDSHMFALNAGPAWSTGLADLGNFAIELSDFRPRILGVDITNTAATARRNSFWVQSKKLEITLSNQTNAVGGHVPVDVIYDVYEFVAAQDISDVLYESPVSTWYNIISTTPTTATALTLNIKGMTPLDTPNFGRFWKLENKTRVVIPFNSDEGQNPHTRLTFSGKKFHYDGEKWVGLFAKKGITKHLMIVLAPDQTDNHFSTYPLVTDIISHIYLTRKGHYKYYHDENSNVGTYVPFHIRSIVAPVTA